MYKQYNFISFYFKKKKKSNNYFKPHLLGWYLTFVYSKICMKLDPILSRKFAKRHLLNAQILIKLINLSSSCSTALKSAENFYP